MFERHTHVFFRRVMEDSYYVRRSIHGQVWQGRLLQFDRPQQFQ